MTFLSLKTLDGYTRLFDAVGCTVIQREDRDALWTGSLKHRLEIYRSLMNTTVARFGEDHFRRWDDTYAFFVGLFGTGQLTGGRLVARRIA